MMDLNLFLVLCCVFSLLRKKCRLTERLDLTKPCWGLFTKPFLIKAAQAPSPALLPKQRSTSGPEIAL